MTWRKSAAPTDGELVKMAAAGSNEDPVYIQGPPGPAPKHDWEGTALAFQNPDGSMGEAVDLKGNAGYTPVKGVDYHDGEDGKTPVKGVDYTDGKDSIVPGPIPKHEWSGSSLSFQRQDGSMGAPVDLKGSAGRDGIVPMYGADGRLWQGVIDVEFETVVDSNGRWQIDYSHFAFTDKPRVHPIAWYESNSASDQAITGGATKSRTSASGRVVRGVSGSLLGVTSTWRFVPAGTPVTITVTGPTK